MAKKFITPVSMRCTQEQYERDLKQPLEELGYVEDVLWNEDHNPIDDASMNYLHSCESFIAWHNHEDYSHFIDHYNPELFLALAAMTEGEESIVGEYLINIYTTYNYALNEITKVALINKEGKYAGEEKPTKDSCCKPISHFKKATKEELIKHFTMKTENRFPFELDLEGARKIIDVACSDWKAKLSNRWGGELLLTNKTFVDESFYKEMRNACNENQHKVLDEVFGKDEESLEDQIADVVWQYHHTFNVIDGFNSQELAKKLTDKFDIKFKE